MRLTKRFFAFLLVFCLCLNSAIGQQYKLLSYLDIKVDSNGNLPRNPYIINIKNHHKQLIVIGTQHTRDTLNPMFTGIENAFITLRPQVVINEGPNLSKAYTSRSQAIATDGELGLEKFLADEAGIKTITGDEPDKQEFEELTAAFSEEEAFVFFASERFIFPFVFGQYKGTLENEYANNFIKGYLEKENISITPKQKQLSYYKVAYRKYFHQDFNLHTIDQHNFTPFGRSSHFNEVTRKSKELRDRYLLKQIAAQLKIHDRVLVIYGGWHVLAIEPTLSQIMQLQ
ncbi:hypothetical protein [Mucilaginibacter sp.]|uniref:hypothetical protein n=1 Tax=Mucilaginibacter sp. TaxID=1882438 RepID=UPI0035BBF61F